MGHGQTLAEGESRKEWRKAEAVDGIKTCHREMEEEEAYHRDEMAEPK